MRKLVEIERQCREKECSFMEEISLLRERCRRLEELSYVDALTGLYNFRYMRKALDIEMERTRRTRLPTSLLMMDLDHFKDINTNYGHECGNTALASVGNLLREGVRVIDVPCRYGGEEFALILPGTSLRQALAIAERLREAVRTNPVVLKNEPVTITASFGAAVFRFVDDCTGSALISRADEQLYRAKASGRDCVCAEDSCTLPAPDEVSSEEKAGLYAPISEDPEKAG